MANLGERPPSLIACPHIQPHLRDIRSVHRTSRILRLKHSRADERRDPLFRGWFEIVKTSLETPWGRKPESTVEVACHKIILGIMLISLGLPTWARKTDLLIVPLLASPSLPGSNCNAVSIWNMQLSNTSGVPSETH